jgi:hypothetical protein
MAVTLLVAGQYNRMLRRREVKTHNVFQLLLEVLIIGKLKAFNAVRLQSVCRPNLPTLEGLTPTSFAIVNLLQCVMPFGLASTVSSA